MALSLTYRDFIKISLDNINTAHKNNKITDPVKIPTWLKNQCKVKIPVPSADMINTKIPPRNESLSIYLKVL